MLFSFADEADLPAVRALIESAYRGEESRAGWTTEADLVEGPRTSVEELRVMVAGFAAGISSSSSEALPLRSLDSRLIIAVSRFARVESP